MKTVGIKVWGILGAGLMSALLCAALRADTLTYVEDKGESAGQEVSLTGLIQTVTKTNVVIKDRGGIETTVSAHRVVSTQYDADPVALKVVRTAVESSQYEDALTQLAAITPEERSAAGPLSVQDIDFYKVYANCQLALSGSRDVTAAAAGSGLIGFVGSYPESWHYYEANRLIGKLLTSMGKFAEAKKYFEILSQSPWPELKYEAMVSLGTILIDEKNLEEAKKSFDSVVGAEDASPTTAEQKFFAQIGLARIAALNGAAQEASQLFDAVVRDSNPENVALQAALYNAIGMTAMESGKNKEAILAFLHVDLLYSSARTEHVKALKNLLILWKKELREDRAAEVQAILRDQYKIAE